MDGRLVAALSARGIDTVGLRQVAGIGDQQIWGLTVGGDVAVDRWRVARTCVPQSAHCPVLVGDSEELERLTEDLEFGADLDEILAAADQFNAPAWFEQRLELVRGDFEGAEGDFELPRGDWPDAVRPSSGFTIPTDILSGEALKEVWLIFVPTARQWEVPAFLMYGNWNECPAPEEHVGIFKYWGELYGAEPVGISADTVEMQIDRPPADRDSAIKLAVEQYAYCADIVDQGTGTIERLAATLLNGRSWYFWWD